MRVLRSTMYGPELAPTTTVVRDSDVVDTLDSLRASVPESVPECFVATEIFEMEDTAIEHATTRALTVMAPLVDDERNMAILFYWTIRQFPLLTDGGWVIMPAPAPLSAEQVRYTFEQIVKHPTFKGYRVNTTANDGTVVQILDGEVR